MSATRLRIGRVQLAGVPREQAQQAEHVLRVAFALLAKKLKRSPIASGAEPELAIRGAAHIGVLQADAVFGPQGAERLAEMLYVRLRQRT
jgi:hypothetical protein